MNPRIRVQGEKVEIGVETTKKVVGMKTGKSSSPEGIYIENAEEQEAGSERYTVWELSWIDSVYTLQFAEDAEYIMRKLVGEYNNWGLMINFERTKYLCVGNYFNSLELDEGKDISGSREYTYLGVTFDDTGTDGKEIEKRITQAKQVIGCLDSVP
ncbi:hypothetical protein HHI36_019815 [Cryptolaemus montrouzieri]|uniref:Uncharacterized protein n=1 Tax=Cryptolaemus montrouzieri TaxID=559131 RepID=A0ABD2N8Q8_9CUCU